MDRATKALFEIEDLQFRMSCAIRLLGVIQEDMETGSVAVEYHSELAFGVYDYLDMLNREMRKQIEIGYSKEETA